jgi:hypothetical protein
LQKYPKTTIVAFACDLFFSFVATMQNSPKRNHCWPWPSQTLKYPASLLVQPKTPWWDRVQICHFTIF